MVWHFEFLADNFFFFVEWNLPVFDGTATDVALANKKLYPTLTRFTIDLGRQTQFFKMMLDTFGLRRFVVIYPKDDPVWASGPLSDLERFFKQRSEIFHLVLIPIKPIADSDIVYEDALRLMNRTARGTPWIR